MKRILQLLILGLTAPLINIYAQNAWTQKADFGGVARGYGGGFAINGKIYIGLGYNGSSPKDFWEYDPSINQWTQKADFPGEARDQMAGFSINDKGYITGGKNAGPNYVYYNDLWEYNPTTNTWKQKANFPGTPRAFTTGFSIGSKGYFGTGYRYDMGTFSDFWEYDPALDKWTQKASFSGGGRSNPTSFSIGNKGYLGIGWNGGWTTDFREYDPATDTWTKKANFGGAAREWAAGFSIGNKGYIGTGYNFSYFKDFWEYDPAADIWTKKADLGGIARNGALGFSVNEKGYIGIGFSGSAFLKDFWEYTPESNACTAPNGLTVTKITDTSATLSWTASGASGFKIRYRIVGSSELMKRNIKATNDHVVLCGLKPNTTYEWQIRSNCTTDTSAWVCGPNFTTASLFAGTFDVSNLSVSNNIKIAPNPNKGNFVLHLNLPSLNENTIVAIYNSEGKKLWQQNLGKIAGMIVKNIFLENKLPAGYYLLKVEREDISFTQKIIVTK